MTLVPHKLERGANTKPMPQQRDREAPFMEHKTRSRAQVGASPHISFHDKYSRFSKETMTA